MHRSKGLEFPFVFLAELETEFSKQDSSKKMHVSDTGRMGLYLYDAKNYQKYQTLSYLVLLKEKKQQLLQEEMRLLYVAMTRAKQKLFLPLQLGRKEKMIARQTRISPRNLSAVQRFPPPIVWHSGFGTFCIADRMQNF